MNDELRTLVEKRLAAEGTGKTNWAGAVLAACDGRNALERCLETGAVERTAAATKPEARHVGAFLSSLTVQGFRGIGGPKTLAFTPGPGLTLIVGRNGSGKSSFAEALEVPLTGDSRRWSERSKVWRDGWRSRHQPHPARVEAEFIVEGQGPTKVSATSGSPRLPIGRWPPGSSSGRTATSSWDASSCRARRRSAA